APPAVDDGALATLETLRGAGYKLALVSNIMRTPGATLREMLARFRLLDYFEHMTFSDEVGIRKPAPEIFAATLRAIGVDAAAAVHVGDDPVLDVQGGRAAGMRVVQVTSSRRNSVHPDRVISRLADLPAAIAVVGGGGESGARLSRVVDAGAAGGRWSGPRRGATRHQEADLLEVAADRVRDAIGVGLEHAIRDSTMVGRAPEIAAPPAEDLRAPT